MKLSIVDLATIKPGETATDALAQSIETAQLADALGFHRIWFAEHHVAPAQASHHPELLIAAAGAVTRQIRLGSGAVLMNHYSAFKVAEMFKQLDAMFPDRIDLGMGRATAGPVLDLALRRDRKSQPVNDHAMQVSEVLAWLHNTFPANHPFADKPLIRSVPTVPETWLLGSSPGGAHLAARLGIGYTFAGFINPAAATLALRTYREQFLAARLAEGEPRAMLGVNVSVGETDEEGQRLALSVKGYYARLSRGDYTAFVPTVEEADRELNDADRAEPTDIVGARWPRFVAGGPEKVKATIEEMVAQSGADEVIIQNMIADPGDRARSHKLFARSFGLTPRDVRA